MGVVSDIIDGAVEVTTSTVDATTAKIYSLAAGIGVLLVLLFLLILFFIEPVSATVLTIILILAVAYVLTSSDTEII